MSTILDPNIQPEKQAIRPLKGNESSQEKPRIGQGRAGMGRRLPPINQTIAQSAEPSKEIPEASKIEKKIINHPYFTTPVQSINNPSAEVINRRPLIKDIPSILIQLTDPSQVSKNSYVRKTYIDIYRY